MAAHTEASGAETADDEGEATPDGGRRWVLRLGKAGGEDAEPRESKRRWLLKTLAMPTAICLVPLLFEYISHKHDERENQFRLYTELLSKREDADMAVRQGIFNKVFDKYLPPDAKDIETRLVGLELMASNFHESVDIGPLFRQLDRELGLEGDSARQQFGRKELERIAEAAKSRQIEGLELAGIKRDFTVYLDELGGDKKQKLHIEERLPRLMGDPGNGLPMRTLDIDATGIDLAHRRLQVQLSYVQRDQERQVLIWASLYDLPLMTFTRISDDERVAVALRKLDTDTQTAEITVLYYPSSRSGIQDKPYIDDVLSRLGKS